MGKKYFQHSDPVRGKKGIKCGDCLGTLFLHGGALLSGQELSLLYLCKCGGTYEQSASDPDIILSGAGSRQEIAGSLLQVSA